MELSGLRADRSEKGEQGAQTVWFSKVMNCQVLVAQVYNPSYSGSRDQENHGSLLPA
jgi:hypothetical protein